MALNPENSSDLEQPALKGLKPVLKKMNETKQYQQLRAVVAPGAVEYEYARSVTWPDGVKGA